MYFHTDQPGTIAFIEAVAGTALDTDTSIRIDVDDHGNLRIKRGQSMWSSPMPSTPDDYRDKSFANIIPAKNYSEGMTLPEVMKDLIDMDATARLESVLRHHYNKVIQEGLDA